MRELMQFNGTMMRIAALLAACALCLAGCFVFDNPYDTRSPLPTATFQIVLSSSTYGGTYVWNPLDNAYVAVVEGTQCSVFMDSGGIWRMADGGNVKTSSLSAYGALPPTSGSGWSGYISSINDSAGGISRPGYPDFPVGNGQTLQVTFTPSDPGNSATYQWERSSSQNGSSPVLLGTLSIYTIQSGDAGDKWIRVIITPTDSAGTINGTPVVSPPVHVP